MKNEPAFPTGNFTDEKGMIIGCSNGMTLRDYFAAKAMQGLFSSGQYEGMVNISVLAESAYKMADAMLKAREA